MIRITEIRSVEFILTFCGEASHHDPWARETLSSLRSETPPQAIVTSINTTTRKQYHNVNFLFSFWPSELRYANRIVSFHSRQPPENHQVTMRGGSHDLSPSEGIQMLRCDHGTLQVLITNDFTASHCSRENEDW